MRAAHAYLSPMTHLQDSESLVLDTFETADDAPALAAGRRAVPGPFDFIEFFNGTTFGWGFFQDRFKRQRLGFTVEMHGRHAGGAFVLEEAFNYADGCHIDRRWIVEREDGDGLRASADDLVGFARGEPFANGVRWRYVMSVPIGDRHVNLTFDDRLFRQTDELLLNLSDATKWGFRVGRLCAVFQKA